MTSASELAKFIRTKCKNKYSTHPIKINPSLRSFYTEKTAFTALKAFSTNNNKETVLLNQDSYFGEIYSNFKLKIGSLSFDFSLGVVDKINLCDKQFSAEIDLFWTNYSETAIFEIKDANWEYPFANFGDITQISVFAYLKKKITGINPNCFIYYAPINNLFEISPISYENLSTIELKYNFGTTLDIEEICGNYHRCDCFEGIDF